MKKLQLGKNPDLIVRDEVVHWHGPNTRLVFASDFHFTGQSASYANELASCLLQLQPDLLILGGDYADTPNGFNVFADMLKHLSGKFPIAWIYGNHDMPYKAKLENIFSDVNAISWHGKSGEVSLNGETIWFDGNQSTQEPHSNLFSIKVLHKPKKPIKLKGWNLILAGHLHGGQWVWFEKNSKLFPGAWFYPQNFLRKVFGRSVYLVSRGLGDTLPLRWNCPCEILHIQLTPISQ